MEEENKIAPKRTIKIFEDDRVIFDSYFSVNCAFFTGKIIKKQATGNRLIVSLSVSNGKDRTTGQWKQPLWVNCTAFGEVAEQIGTLYNENEKITLAVKFTPYKDKEGNWINYFRAFAVLDPKEPEEQITDWDGEFIGDSEIPF